MRVLVCDTLGHLGVMQDIGAMLEYYIDTHVWQSIKE